MTTKKLPSEMRKAAIVKATRAAIRTKHSIAADYELNERLPEVEAAFDSALQRGELPENIDLDVLAKEVVNRA